jgi:two-component system, NtrC family, nitrogen regulation sensor histidine kinase NtrY
MIFRRFTIRIVILIILISLAGMLVLWSFYNPHLAVARFSFIILWILLIISLIAYVNKTNRTLSSFLDSIKTMDEIRKSPGKGKTFEELDTLYHEITAIIRQAETDRETERQFFRYIIDHTGVGIIALSESGDIEMINAAAKNLLKIRQPKNVSSLASLSPEIPELFTSLKPGTQKLLKLVIGNEIIRLSIKAAIFRINARKVRLVSIQNIKAELEEEELDAWQKLIRVLTHEIVNSVTPVNSLTHTIIRMLERDGIPRPAAEIDEQLLSNVLEGLHSIEKRNKGLIGFVQSYRSLTRIQKPVFTKISVESLFMSLARLVREDLEQAGIHLYIGINPAGLALDGDEKLLEQVLINLINNARHALGGSSNPAIELSAKYHDEHVIIGVKDNGSGIPEEIMGSIFIPFFTTREHGTGIGLSLSRQIIRLHHGTISVTSVPGKETVFTITVPA